MDKQRTELTAPRIHVNTTDEMWYDRRKIAIDEQWIGFYCWSEFSAAEALKFVFEAYKGG